MNRIDSYKYDRLILMNRTNSYEYINQFNEIYKFILINSINSLFYCLLLLLCH